MDKKTIILVAGKSGSGKSELANYLYKERDIPYLQSYTTRKQRDLFDTGHKFLSNEEMDSIWKRDDVLAKTVWTDEQDNTNKIRYCCLEEDLSGLDTYVIDEKGIDFLVEKFSDKYNLFKVYIHREEDLRKLYVNSDRIERDNKMFYKFMKDYDMVITNNSTVEGLYNQANILVNRINLLTETKWKQQSVAPKLCKLEDPDCEACQ